MIVGVMQIKTVYPKIERVEIGSLPLGAWFDTTTDGNHAMVCGGYQSGRGFFLSGVGVVISKGTASSEVFMFPDVDAPPFRVDVDGGSFVVPLEQTQAAIFQPIMQGSK